MPKIDLGSRKIGYDASKKYLTIGIMAGSGIGNVLGHYEITPKRMDFLAKRIKRGGEGFESAATYLMWELDKIDKLFQNRRIGLHSENDIVLEEADKKHYRNAVSFNRRMLSAMRHIIDDKELQGMGYLKNVISEALREHPSSSYD